MTLDYILVFILGILTCIFCFFLFRDTIILHMLQNIQAIPIADNSGIQKLQEDINKKLTTFIDILIKTREGLVILVTSLQNLSEGECHDSIAEIQKALDKIEKELDVLENMGLIEKEDEKW